MVSIYNALINWVKEIFTSGGVRGHIVNRSEDPYKIRMYNEEWFQVYLFTDNYPAIYWF